MLKKWKYLWISLSVLFGLILMLPVILNNIDLNQYKASIESSVTELTGRQLKIDGDLQLKLSLHPFIRIEKVSFANASWSKRPQMLSFDVLQLQVELLPLLKKQLVIEQLRLRGVVLVVEKNMDGQLNWLLENLVSDEAEPGETATESTSFELPLIPVFKQVEFDAIDIHYSDVDAEIETSINLVMLRLSNQTINEPFSFQANGMINKHPFDFNGETKFQTDAMNNSSEMQGIEQEAGVSALSVKLNAHAIGATLSASGVIKLFEADNDIQIETSLDVPDLNKTLFDATGKSLKQLSISTAQPVPLKLSARLTSRRDHYNLQEIKLQLADSDLDGEVTFINHPERPEIQAKLHSEKINVSQLLAKTGKQAASKKTKPAAKPAAKPADKEVTFELPDTPLPFELLESLDANIHYSAGKILAAGLDARAIKLSAVLQSGKLQIEQFDFDLDKATVRSRMSFDSQTKTPAVSASIDIKLELAPIAKIFTLTQLQQGRLNTAIKFKGRGDNLRSLLLSLRGQSHIQLEQIKASQQVDNKLYDFYIETLDLNFTEMSAPLKYALEGSVDKEIFSLSGELSTLTSLLNNSATTLNLKTVALGAALSLDSRIEKPLIADAAQANVALTISEPEKTITRLTRLLPGIKIDYKVPAQPVRLMTRLDISADNFSAKNIELNVGVSDLSGEVSVNIKEKKPVITVNLSSKLMDLDSLLPPRDNEKKLKPKQEKAGTGGRLFSTEPLPRLDALNSFNATVHYRLKKLTANKKKIQNISLDLVLEEGELQVDPLTMDLSKGTFKARLKLSEDVNLRLQADIEINTLPYDILIAMIGIEEFARGHLDAEIHLQGTGRSVSDLMAGLNGKVRITTEHGYMYKQAMKLLSSDISSLIPFTSKDDKQEIRCAVIDFNVNNGIAETHALLIDTGIVSALGSGKIDLATETLSLYIDPRAKRTSVMKLALVPLNVTGSLTSPSIKPDVVGSTLSTTRTATTIGIAVATVGISLIVEGATNKLWEQFIDDTDYCTLALAGEKVVPILKKLGNHQDEYYQDEYYPDDQNGQDYDYIEELDDDYGGF